MEQQLRQTEEGVLKVYQEVNPSSIPIEERKEFERQDAYMKTLFRDRLKFPLKMFKGARVLDFGSGTGEKCVFYAMQGARLTCVEMNPLAIKRLEGLFDRFGLTSHINKVYNRSLFEFDAEGKAFDIAISMGVLHHTQDPKRGFDNLVSHISPGGHVIVALGNTAGGFQRNLQRLLLFRLGKGDKETMVRLALEFFPDHIERATRAVGRTKEAMVYDSFINPKIRYVSIPEMLGWFAEHHIRFYSCWPPLQFPTPLADSERTAPLRLEQEEYQDMLSFPELFWMMANRYDKDVLMDQKENLQKMGRQLRSMTQRLNDVTPESAYSLDLGSFVNEVDSFRAGRVMEQALVTQDVSTVFLSEVADVLRALDVGASPEEIRDRIRGYRALFKGYCGLGLTFIVGYKEDNPPKTL